ncbi:hypothetical protein GLOTRDRAFT_127156 [Gloeophyllum trabeum ATCC 11539]|uniref:Peptidase S33 tripeptidyl aminopeptidase-like C-terminal domain-containing protein n=1 Tax=Gloeophyllum trabeum (strain ATCC 11539 / FP-39264 / Madison 617) TaxID=670483 RepID=S7QFN7_GLOTA|nr:uncharacterized protein GLOTRDRAFT_127156 [Gloeophyllum trabeum ATCC 11539]EPQ58666.1 hypothetical protein GLOTRDRAFT_127156 [Gloeophyllum trabeum ATCC 11539]
MRPRHSLRVWQNSPQVEEVPFVLDMCVYVPDVQPWQSRYNGTFGLATAQPNIATETYDPATPYVNALSSLQRLGSNARLIQQAEGHGHTTLSQLSFYTLELVQAYLLDGVVPADSHTDQQPFVPLANRNGGGSGDLDSRFIYARAERATLTDRKEISGPWRYISLLSF